MPYGMMKLLFVVSFSICVYQSLQHPFQFYRSSKGGLDARSTIKTDVFLRKLSAMRARAEERMANREALPDSGLRKPNSERMGRTCYFSPVQCLIVWPKDRISSYVEINQAGIDGLSGDNVRLPPLPTYDSSVNIASLNHNLLEALKPRKIERG
ncbi:hypothetical protein QR680_002343 [Steinernema hermaphroditum]|uniref:Uncharacterized protein n=1 Tax=Steinernema hermaphroditum TaxID=289476 RepID=A0AA39H2C1_9BILA|nr:hypothetical protein QR680_002343 [Steinernema hermaphroditum]